MAEQTGFVSVLVPFHQANEDSKLHNALKPDQLPHIYGVCYHLCEAIVSPSNYSFSDEMMIKH